MKGNNINLKTPRLYKVAAKIIREAEKNGSSLKTLIYSAKHPNRAALYALVHQTLKYKHVIKRITDKVRLFEAEPRLDQTIAQLLIYELLYSKKQSLKGESRAVVAVLNHENEVRKAFQSLETGDNCCDNNPVPIGTFFGSRRVLTEFIGVAESQSYIYAVAFTVIAIHIILGALLYEAYTEEVSLSAQQTDQKKEY